MKYSGHISSPLSIKACAVDNGSAGISTEAAHAAKKKPEKLYFRALEAVSIDWSFQLGYQLVPESVH